MKEITIKLEGDIGSFIHKEAADRGISDEAMLKYIIGTWVRDERESVAPTAHAGIIVGDFGGLLQRVFGGLSGFMKEALKEKARAGELTCKNCTLKLTEQSIDDGKCSACGAPLRDALELGGPQSEL